MRRFLSSYFYSITQYRFASPWLLTRCCLISLPSASPVWCYSSLKNEVNIRWLQFCMKSLSESPRCYTLMPCLSSLVCVSKELLRDENLQQGDILQALLQPLDPAFEGLCSSLLSDVRAKHCQTPALDPELSCCISCLLDLIELLVALRIKCQRSLPLCHKVLSVTIPQAFTLVSSSPVAYYVKRQFILVLKKSLLKKAGEDFYPVLYSLSQPGDPVLEQEIMILVLELLNSIHQGWLLQVPVSDRISCFGGSNKASESSPDLVVLAAVCLSVLKALEIQLLEVTICSIIEDKLQSVMDQLLAFLRHHLGWQKPCHPCEWVSLIFIEQDDDMLEVANILLKLYLRCQTLWSQVPACAYPGGEMEIWDGISHRFGCDPHCIFILLLNNVAFDTSVLLDFLISSETCFLEYFVRYLKLLKEDWPRFCLTCTLLELASCRKGSAKDVPNDVPNSFSLQGQTASVTAAVVPQNLAFVNLQESLSLPTSISDPITKKNKGPIAPSQVSSYECTSSLGALQRLVAYDSSEDSESECSEEQDHPVTVQIPGTDSTDIYKQMGKLKLKGEYPAFSATPAPTKTTDNTNLITGTLLKSARCLEELQQAINKLHKKQLFPYNPSALLRLLIHVCTLNREMREGKIAH
ncbi:protein Lines homolog 1 isoform X2 [Xenopus laevis]|uniref:Protein Lines homolog 1 isoform X2 n=1 Tax=Xenopus laevis TaxID=8355 RepID=A0A8J0UVX8_XENLA|nr:protein Lines homolog 1 isoform X2 [Xenopus laevis]